MGKTDKQVNKEEVGHQCSNPWFFLIVERKKEGIVRPSTTWWTSGRGCSGSMPRLTQSTRVIVPISSHVFLLSCLYLFHYLFPPLSFSEYHCHLSFSRSMDTCLCSSRLYIQFSEQWFFTLSLTARSRSMRTFFSPAHLPKHIITTTSSLYSSSVAGLGVSLRALKNSIPQCYHCPNYHSHVILSSRIHPSHLSEIWALMFAHRRQWAGAMWSCLTLCTCASGANKAYPSSSLCAVRLFLRLSCCGVARSHDLVLYIGGIFYMHIHFVRQPSTLPTLILLDPNVQSRVNIGCIAFVQSPISLVMKGCSGLSL